MPEPSSIYSTDMYIYKYITNPIASKNCYLKPNYITIFAICLTIPVVYGLLNNWSTQTMILLIILRTFLDCLDGAVARKCNKFSEFGGKLDGYGYLLFNSCFILTMIYLLYNKSNIIKYIGIIFIVLFVILINIKGYDWIYGDNTIILNVLIMYIFNEFNNSII